MKRDISELSFSLSSRAEEVAMMLLPGGHRLNGSWVAGDINGGEGHSLTVHVEGQHTGKWRDWADGDEYRGDLIDLWRMSRGLTPKEAIKQVKEFLGIHDPVTASSQKVWSAPRENSVPKPDGVIYQYLMAERRLDATTIQAFNVKGRKIKEDIFIAFPCHAPSGEIQNNSYRSLLPIDDGKKKVFQDKGCAPCLFGWQAFQEADYASRTVLLCEGQIDAMTWRQWGIPALSVPNGSGTTWIEHEWENLEMFHTIYLSFDMDGKTQDALQKTISRLGKHRCMVVHLPEKDANDALKAGRTSEEAKGWAKSAKAPAVKDFICAKDLKQRVIDQFYPNPLTKKAIKIHLMTGRTKEKSFTVRPGEVSLWTGIAGHGKSTFLKDVFMDLVNQEERCMITSLEMKADKILKNMIQSAFGVEVASHHQIEGVLEQVGHQLFFCDKIGYITPLELLEMMEFAHCRHGVTQFMIDSLMRIEGLEEDYPAQGMFLNRLSAFSKTYDSHVHLVTHPRKTEGDATPTGNDLKGSSLLRNNADNILVVSRNFKKEKKKAEGESGEDEDDWDAKVVVEKDRDEGYVKIFKYQYKCAFQRYCQIKQ